MKRQLINSKLWIKQTKGHSFNLDTVLLANFVKLNFKIKSVLDIGCRTGDFLMHFDEKVKKEGVDFVNTGLQKEPF